ncbi:MAG: DUF3160 domain-containing protein [Nitrospirae bacterium]|nr:DUF3160 domain-containing protein [Nitrospirota bacterium]
MLFRFRVLFLIIACGFILSDGWPLECAAKVLSEQTSVTIDTKNPLFPSMLSGLSLRDLWLLKNEIYARHGKSFRTYELHAYFLKKGFKPDRDYADSRLTKAEIRNINLINKRIGELKAACITETSQPLLDEGCISNLFQYGSFNEDQMRLIKRNGFVVTPAKHEQLYHVYEQNDYDKVPSFITTDSLLQIYSILFDNTLRRAEEGKLRTDLLKLTEAAMKIARKKYETSGTDLSKKKSAKESLAYFSVPYVLLSGDSKKLHNDIKGIVGEEIARIEAHALLLPPAILAADNAAYEDPDNKDLWVDYTQFVPRGHYTRSDALKSYFKAALWYGLYPLHIRDGFEQTALTALMVKDILFEAKLIDLWRDIYTITAFYAGSSDDLDPMDLNNMAEEAFGRESNYSDKEKLKIFIKIAKDKYKSKTRIKHIYVDAANNKKEQGAIFKLMGQRYIPDSEIMQRLVTESRLFPKGLDVMAALGNRLSESLMLNNYKADWQKGFPEYPKELEKLKSEFGHIDEAGWKKNLYMSWLWSLKSLFEAHKEGNMQFFFKGNGWEAKSLNTSLASWTELRHNTILYAKQSMIAAEAGEGGEEHWVWFPEPPRGYVEPNAEFFKRLITTIDLSEKVLESSGLMEKGIKEDFSIFREMVLFLKGIVDKENKGIERTTKEYARIIGFGGELEQLTLRILVMVYNSEIEWGEMNDYEKRIPIVADVHTAYYIGEHNVLEEAVGWANEIYVAVEEGGLYRLTRGAVFTYYEFRQPASDRLTDEKWQDILISGKNIPAAPEWTNIFSSALPAAGPNDSYREEWSDPPGWKQIYY